jgi:transposase
MKSKDLQKLVFSKQQNGEGLAKICRDLDVLIGYRTIRRWCKMISETGSINLSSSTGRVRTARSKAAIRKGKSHVKREKPLSARRIALELEISERSVRRILRDDLHLKPYEKIVEPLITDAHRAKRVKFANWVRINLREEDTMRILFSDEKMSNIDGVYNAQNDRVWAADRTTANRDGGKIKRRRFP